MNLIPKRLRRPWVTTRTTLHNDNSTIEFYSVPAIVTPYPRWYEHPVWWWKMRHLRHDIKVMNEAVDPDFKRMVDEALDNAFLNGTGGM